VPSKQPVDEGLRVFELGAVTAFGHGDDVCAGNGVVRIGQAVRSVAGAPNHGRSHGHFGWFRGGATWVTLHQRGEAKAAAEVEGFVGSVDEGFAESR
jgi:hypothetical protein